MGENKGRRALIHFVSDDKLKFFKIAGTPIYCNDVVETPYGLKFPVEYVATIVKTGQPYHAKGILHIPWSNIKYVFWPDEAKAELPSETRIGFRQDEQ